MNIQSPIVVCFDKVVAEAISARWQERFNRLTYGLTAAFFILLFLGALLRFDDVQKVVVEVVMTPSALQLAEEH